MPSVSAEHEKELHQLQDRLVDFEMRMLRRIDYLQEVDEKRDGRLKRMAAWPDRRRPDCQCPF